MPAFTDLKNGKFLFTYNRETIMVEGKEQHQFDAVELDKPERDSAIFALIGLKYSVSSEIALINNRIIGDAEDIVMFDAYQQFRNDVKAIVDLSIAG